MITLDPVKIEGCAAYLRLIVKAKRDGMMDHREAKELWTEVLRTISVPETRAAAVGSGVHRG